MADLHDEFENEQDLSKAFENEAGAPKSDRDLMQAGGNFDMFNKLTPQERTRLEQLQKKDSSENLEALGRGASQGATLGFQDELSPVVEKAFAQMFGDEGTKAIYADKSYQDLRDTYRQQNQAAKEKAPLAYLAGQVGGATPLAIATGGAGNAASKGIQAATGAGKILSGIAGQGATGAALGATQGLGNSTAELTPSQATPDSVMQAAKDTGKGGAIGAAVPIAIGGGAAGLQALADNPEAAQAAAGSIQEMANTQAVKSLNPTSSQLASMNLKGQTQQVGQKLLDEDLVPTLSTATGRAQKLQQFTQEAGAAQAPAAQAVDVQAAKLIAQQSPEIQQQVKTLLSPQGLVDHLQEEIMDPLMASGDPASTAPKVQELLDKIGNMGDQTGGQLSFSNLNSFRQRLDKMINYETPRGSDLQSTLKQFRTTLDDSLGDTANKIDSLAGTDLADAFAKTKSDYASGIKATKLAFAQEAKDPGLLNSLGGRSAAGGAIAKMAGVDPITGAAIGAASKAVQSNAINRFTANTLNTVAGVVRQSPQTLGQYAAPLQEALTRGPEALSAMIFTLQQRDPEFREKYNSLLDSQPKNGSQPSTTPSAGPQNNGS